MRTRSAALVGRETELRVLAAALTDALTVEGAGRGAVVVVRGPAGIGKTRLVAETLGEVLPAGVPVLRGRASATGLVAPLRPFSEALAALQRRGALPGPDVLAGYHTVLGRVLPDLAGPDTSRLPESSIAFAEAMLRVLMHAGSDRGCVLVLEDVHDADDETLAVIEYLADNLADVPAALVVTLRDTASPALAFVDQLQRRGAVETIRLAPLGRDDLPALVRSCLGGGDADLPDALVELVWNGTGGGPLQVEELLFELVESGQLMRADESWQLVGTGPDGVTAGVERSITTRLGHLDPRAARLLATAALLGDTFPVEVVHHAAGSEQREFFEQLQSAVRAQLLVAADRPDWYGFAHPVIREVALRQASPEERREQALALADTVVALRPRLADGWRAAAAELYEIAGRGHAAVSMLLAAGRRALDGGDPATAVRLLSRALVDGEDAGDEPGADEFTDTAVREALLRALIDVGQLDRAKDLVAGSRDPGSRADAHLALAWAFHLAGRSDAARDELAAARLVDAGDAGDPAVAAERQAHFEATAANLALDDNSVDDPATVEQFAREAAARAESAGAVEAACRAWHAVARLARLHDLAESSRSFERLVALARQHELRGWIVLGLVGLAGNAWLGEGDAASLDVARRQADADGAVQLSLAVAANLVLDDVLRNRLDHAAEAVAGVLAESTRLGNRGLVAYSTMTTAVLHAHAGRRAEATEALARLDRLQGDPDSVRNLAVGLGLAVLDVLDSEDGQARATLRTLALDEAGHRSMFQLTGTAGLLPLLDALAGDLDRAAIEELLASTRGGMRWNRQFAELALAVVAGAAGDHAAAEAAARRAREAASLYPLALHLGTRLVGERAADDGWGEPVRWLREAEQWFHDASLETASRACRAILRRLGEQVGQRREGAGEIPPDVRKRGVTVREFEVYRLVLDKHGNKAIAERLHISPRTVEKHIASLLAKYGVESRSSLILAGRGEG